VAAVGDADIERVFRAEHGRAVAVLVRVFGDIDVAEEAVQDAFAEAVRRWPAAGLHPASTATVVRAQDGDVLVTDGPFAEGKEHLGGFTIITAPDLDAALEWSAKMARASTLPVEVRPLQGEAGY